jgi:uncharacterized protein YndB with AHSA1/START domain
MTITDVAKDPEARTMTITSEFGATVDRVWQLWADPRRLERWWGPPTHPATVVEHDLTPGGEVAYFVTGPDGERRQGWWRVVAVDPPHHLAFELRDPDIPTITMTVSIRDRDGGGSSMVIEAAFPSGEAMDQLLLMGFEGGLSAAVGQIDALLPELTADLDR